MLPEYKASCRLRWRLHQGVGSELVVLTFKHKCSSEEPQMKEVASGHYVACHYPADSELNQ